MLRGVHFDFNKYNIRAEDAAVLDEAAATTQGQSERGRRRERVLRLDWWCSSTISDSPRERADAVVDYLEKDGIPADRLAPHGYGKTDFVATNRTSRRPCAEPAGRVGTSAVGNRSA